MSRGPESGRIRRTASHSRGTSSHGRVSDEQQQVASYDQIITSPPELHGQWTPDAMSEVIRRVVASRSVCFLLVSDGKSEKCLYFPIGGLRLTSVGERRGVPLRWMIRAHPGCTPELERVLDRIKVGSGEATSLEDVLSGELRQIAQACSKRIVRDEIMDLMVWDGAEYEFRGSNPPPVIFEPEYEAVKLSLGVKKLLEEVKGSIGEWKKLRQQVGVPSRTMVYDQGGSAQSDHLSNALMDSLSKAGPAGMLLGDMVLRGRRAGADALSVCQRVHSLAKEGAVRIDSKPPPPSPPVAKKRAQSALSGLEAALELMINKLAAHRRLAEVYKDLGDEEQAVEQLQHVGNELEKRNDPEGAIKVYREIVGITPHAFAAREHIARMLEKLGKTTDAVREWLSLARQFAKFRLFNRAQDRVRSAIKIDRGNFDLRRYLIDTLMAMGKRKEAAQEYTKLAKLYEEKGQDVEALACYQQIGELDPGDVEAQAALIKAAQKARGKMGMAPFIVVLGSALALAGGAWFVHDRYTTLQALQEARGLAMQAAQEQRFADAHKALDDFQASFGASEARLAGTRAGIRALEDLEARDRYVASRALEAEQNIDDARRGYQALVVEFPESKWSRMSEKRLKNLQEEGVVADQMAREIAGLLEEGGREQAAFKKAIELFRKYPWSAAARATEFPVRVETVPDQATVEVGGKRQRGVTPSFARLHGPKPAELRVTRDGYEPALIQVEPGAVVPPRWPLQAELQKKLRWSRETLGPLAGGVNLGIDDVLVAGSDQRVYALERDGRVRWTYTLDLFSEVVGAPIRRSGMVIVVLDSGKVLGLSLSNGALVWRKRIAEDGLHAVGGLKGVGAIVATDRRVFALDAKTGNLRWKVDLPGPLAGPMVVHAEKRRFFGLTKNGRLAIVDARGKLFNLKIDGRPVGRPVPGERGCLVTTEDGVLSLVWDEVLWSKDLGGPVSDAPLFAEDVVYVPMPGKLLCLAEKDGSQRWVQEFAAPLNTPSFKHGRLYVTTRDGKVHGLVARSGRTRWVYRTGGEILAAPSPAGNAVLVASTDRILYAIADD